MIQWLANSELNYEYDDTGILWQDALVGDPDWAFTMVDQVDA